MGFLPFRCTSTETPTLYSIITRVTHEPNEVQGEAGGQVFDDNETLVVRVVVSQFRGN